MNFIDLAKKRYSVRSYTSKKVEKDKIDAIVEAACVAPTGANRQSFRILVVESPEGLEKLVKNSHVPTSRLAFIICANQNEAWKRGYDGKTIEEIDASIATDHMMLEATDLGLGSVWICNFSPAILKTDFAIPAYLEPIHILVVGYTDEKPKSPDRHLAERKDISQIVSYI